MIKTLMNVDFTVKDIIGIIIAVVVGVTLMVFAETFVQRMNNKEGK